MTSEELAPPGIDTSVPSVARVYDFLLGGKDNFAVDRAVSQQALKITPDGTEAALANREFLRRVIRHLVVEEGINQFLDIGSGLPTQGNVHEIAKQYDPTARVVYVDNDPIVLAHGRALLADAESTIVVQADIRNPADILDNPEARRLIDFSRPVGLLLFAILHHLSDDEDPLGIAVTLREALPSGSCLAISHFRDPGERHPDASRKALEVEKLFNQTLGTGRWRTDEEILAYVAGLDVVEPGLVPLAEWRPEPGTSSANQSDTYHTFVGVVARKP